MTIPPHIMAADNALLAASYVLSMLTEEQTPADRVILLDAALSAVRRAEGFMAASVGGGGQ